MKLDERKKRILQAIVEDYILTAAPVGSRAIQDKYPFGLSSATIRNEMSDLEDMGYLMQPHVSAGRVPVAKAYRLYVDDLADCQGEDCPQAEALRQHIISRVHQLGDVVASTAEALSELTNYASVVMMPKQEELRITSLQLIPISRASALLVVVTDGGIMRDSFVHVADGLDNDALYAISRMLSERLRNRTLGEAQELMRAYALHAPWDPAVLSGIAELAAQLERQSSSDSLKVSGAHHMLKYPEYSDVAKAREVLAALNETDSLLSLLKEDAGSDLMVRIGPETGIPTMEELSIVTASYQVGRRHRGAIGIIGPTRMPYPQLLVTLRVAGSTLSQMLSTPA
ncbi:MAG: heat-inducible transcription repressor HrcA [Clostridiales bacterium]|nr:heat-inducible transcription repressor HrcA [Clostridiales bacterium]